MRELMLTVVDGDGEAVPILYQMQPLTRLKDILRWLIQNKITGHNFVEWYRVTHDKSTLSIASWALKFIRKDLDPQPLYLDKDWLR